MQEKYKKIQTDVLKQIIGSRDPVIVSRKLGYKFNQVSRWLNFSKKLKWNEFVDLCFATQFHIEPLMEDVFGISIRTKNECKRAFIKILLSQVEMKKTIGKSLRKSAATLYRLQKMKTYPDFESVLALMDLKQNRLRQFHDSILKQTKVQPTKKYKSPISIPWFSVVSAAMAQKEHLAKPTYSPEWIANRVQLSAAQVEQAVQSMAEHELIQWNGQHYEPTQPRTIAINQQRSRAEFLDLMEFWSKKAISAIDSERKKRAPSEDFKGVIRTYRTNKQTAEKIDLMIADFEEKVHNLVSSTEGDRDEIRCFVFSHFEVRQTKIV